MIKNMFLFENIEIGLETFWLIIHVFVLSNI